MKRNSKEGDIPLFALSLLLPGQPLRAESQFGGCDEGQGWRGRGCHCFNIRSLETHNPINVFVGLDVKMGGYTALSSCTETLILVMPTLYSSHLLPAHQKMTRPLSKAWRSIQLYYFIDLTGIAAPPPPPCRHYVLNVTSLMSHLHRKAGLVFTEPQSHVIISTGSTWLSTLPLFFTRSFSGSFRPRHGSSAKAFAFYSAMCHCVGRLCEGNFLNSSKIRGW